MWWTWLLLLLTMDGTHSWTYNKFLEQQFTAPWLLLLLSMDGTHSWTYNKFLEQQLTATCPYTEFCTVGPSKTIGSRKYTPCCRDCSCQPDCYIRGRCCPDNQHVGTNLKAAVPCSLPSPKHNGEFALNGHNYGVNFYHIFNTCSPNFKDQSIIAKCLYPDFNSLDENKIVSDASGQVFKNRNCARCNGVTVVRDWILKVLCNPFAYNIFASLSSFAELMSLEGWSVAFVPPDETTTKSVSPSTCVKVDHSICNETGNWDKFDINIKIACEASGILYEYIFEKENKVYKNVFCLLCNHAASVNMIRFDVCAVNEDIAEKGRYSKPAFSALLASIFGQDHSSSHEGDIGSTECSTTELYDIYLDKCRHLQCPIALTPLNGKCVDVYSEVNGLTIGFTISAPITGITELKDNEQQFREVASSVITYIQNQLDFQGKQCMQCGIVAHLDEKYARIVLEFAVQTSELCQASTVIDTLYRWKSKNPTTNISNKILPLEMDFRRFTYELNGHTYQFAITLLIGKITFACAKIAAYLQELFYCPFVDIPAEEYDELLLHHSDDIDEDSFTLIKPHDGNSTYRICVDKYMIPVRNQAMSNRNTSSVIAIVALLIVVDLLKQ